MLSSLLAISWEPQIHGIVVVLIAVTVLMGSVYLILGTNLGARLGILIALAGLFGWMLVMSSIWWVYGIGLKGREPTWKPAAPISIIRDGTYLNRAGVLDAPIRVSSGATPTEVAQTVEKQLEVEKWVRLDDANPSRGQAAASADDIIQNKAKEFAAGEYLTLSVYDRGGERTPKINKTLDFIAFFHAPHYALVEFAPLLPQRSEPGRAPAKPVIDNSQPHRYLVMVRDLGSRRQPAMFISLGSGLIFGILCLLLHRRDRYVLANATGELNSAKV
jgi:hypothetical protein